MNNILQLKGRFEHRDNPNTPRLSNIPKNRTVTSQHLITLSNQLKAIKNYWQDNPIIEGALISVHYNQIVAKSNRLKVLFTEKYSQDPSNSIRGAKFVWEKNQENILKQKHVFTYYISLSAIDKSIELLIKGAEIIKLGYSEEIHYEDLKEIIDNNKYSYKDILAKTNFVKLVHDTCYVHNFDIDTITEDITEESIITIFKTNVETKSLLSKIGITIVDDRIIDDTTLRLNPDEIKLLQNEAPYLIAMNVIDMTEINKDDLNANAINDLKNGSIMIPHPNNEPIVGVIDTHFDNKVYFKEWVDYKNMLDSNITLTEEDYYHGTEVSSIIVDGPRGNPNLEDGCGRFRVRHFGVATHRRFSSFTVLKLIRKIVAANRDIKVWNLSLGSEKEVKESFISPEAYELDKIQAEYDVIFIVAGTNKPQNIHKENMKIGAPADSLNSLVVNSVNFNDEPASYTRVGPVLSFFNKPDVCYYGGDGISSYEKIAVCRNSLGAYYVKGTSFAAPWITRKIAYLIHVMGLSREVAKALIIDSAAGWSRRDDLSHTKGFGIVPVHINDIIYSNDDEIRFILTGMTDDYETFNYSLPVPIVNGAHPYYARATLIYFPFCDRNQGVDYTSTEMDIKFGRVRLKKNNKVEIKSLDQNMQNEEGLHIIYEEDARKFYRKWDNVKHISDEIKTRKVPRIAYESGMYGLSIKTKERMFSKKKSQMPFGVVVTLKEMNGVNRIEDFIKACMAKNWFVNRLIIENQIDIYFKSEEDIEWQ